MCALSKPQKPLLKQIRVRPSYFQLLLQYGAMEFYKKKHYHIGLQINEDF